MASEKLQDFVRRSPFKDVEGFDEQVWAQFVATLKDLMAEGPPVRKSIVSASTGGSGGSGGGTSGGGSTPGTGGGAQVIPILADMVANTISAQVGNFIFRSGSSIGLADNRDLAMQATDYVYAVGPGVLFITPIYKGKNPTGTETDGRILMAEGKGTSANAILYLYRDGLATDDIEQVINPTTGRFQNDAKFLQQIAIRTGTPRTVFVTGDVNVHRPGTG